MITKTLKAVVDFLFPQPEIVSRRVVVEGNVKHRHQFEQVPWDEACYGEAFTVKNNVDLFTTAISKRLYRCPCGREVITLTEIPI